MKDVLSISYFSLYDINFSILDESPPMELVIVQKSRPICQTDFLVNFGKILMKSKTMNKPMNEDSFEIHENLWTITGNLWIKRFIEEDPKYTVITMDW